MSRCVYWLKCVCAHDDLCLCQSMPVCVSMFPYPALMNLGKINGECLLVVIANLRNDTLPA